MVIRRISASEVNLAAEMFDKYRVFYGQPSNIELARNFLQVRLDNNESVIFVAFLDSDGVSLPAGFTQLYPTYSSVRVIRNWILNDLYVEATLRKKGIGEELIRAATVFAKENGAVFVELSTAVDNHTAQSLYEQIGFRKVDPDKDFFTYRISV